MNNSKLRLALFLLIAFNLKISIVAQVAINSDGSEAHSSAILDIKSTSKGLLIPRMTQSEIESINNPANGLFVFNTTDNAFYVFTTDSNNWKEIDFGTGTLSPSSSWNCGDALSYEGQNYTTVEIGTQCWMSENLNVGTMVNGSVNQTSGNGIEKYCYDNNTANCNNYGGFYQWDEMMQYVTTEGAKGICPDGWHIPSDTEIKTLEVQLGMTQTQADGTGYRGTNQGSKMATNAALWNDGALENDSQFSTSGFNLLPAGYRLTDGTLGYFNVYAVIWSSTVSGTNAIDRDLVNNNTGVNRNPVNKTYGLSVRCLKD